MEIERERRTGGGERHFCEGEILIDGLLERARTGDRPHNLGMCPDWELRGILFCGTTLQPSESDQPGQVLHTFHF